MKDWSAYEEKPEDVCRCRCGEVYKSHTVFDDKLQNMVSRKKCPHCGSDHNLTQITDGKPPQGVLAGIL